MSTYYVSKSGNDANAGTSYALSKLTIQAAINIMGTYNSLIIGAGLYNEKITLGGNNTAYCDGIVILDGTGIGNSNSAIYLSSSTIIPLSTGGLLVVQNHIASILVSIGNYTSGGITNAIFISNSNTNCVSLLGGDSNYVKLSNCIISGFTNGVTGGGNQSYFTVSNCTFYNVTTAISIGSSIVTISWCIFSNITTAWSIGALSIIDYLNDNQYYNVTNWKIGANTYTTLPQVQAINVNYDSRSIVANPNFTDVTNNIFYLKSASSVGSKIGAFPYGITGGASNDFDGKWLITGSVDNSGWYNPDGNVSKNGVTGFFELVGGLVGVIWSPVMDIGSIQSISQLDLTARDKYPYSVIDSTNADVLPNYQTSEIRVSNTTFNQDDGVIAWTTVKNNCAFTLTLVGRYVQLRITIRNNGVAA
jgi:hypothetical protein